MQKEVLGTIYTEVSEDFQRGIYPIARCIKAEKHDLSVVYAVRGADMEVKQIGNLTENAKRDNPNRRRVYDNGGLAPTLTSGMGEGGNLQPFIIVAVRGRNPDNPSDRTAGNPTEQRLEPNSQGICNTLTSVQKDNMVLIKQATKDGYIECNIGGVADFSYPNSKTRRGRVQRNGEICPTITATETEIHKIESQYRIRKLTPLECWRLMGFSDEDFLSAKLGSRKSAKETLEKYPYLGKRAFTEVQRIEKMSNSQLYKQAGNSIVKNVLTAIFGQMIYEKENIKKSRKLVAVEYIRGG